MMHVCDVYRHESILEERHKKHAQKKSALKIPQITRYHFSVFHSGKIPYFRGSQTTIRSRCATDVRLMHSSIRRPAVPSFHILCGPFVKKW